MFGSAEINSGRLTQIRVGNKRWNNNGRENWDRIRFIVRQTVNAFPCQYKLGLFWDASLALFLWESSRGQATTSTVRIRFSWTQWRSSRSSVGRERKLNKSKSTPRSTIYGGSRCLLSYGNLERPEGEWKTPPFRDIAYRGFKWVVFLEASFNVKTA